MAALGLTVNFGREGGYACVYPVDYNVQHEEQFVGQTAFRKQKFPC